MWGRLGPAIVRVPPAFRPRLQNWTPPRTELQGKAGAHVEDLISYSATTNFYLSFSSLLESDHAFTLSLQEWLFQISSAASSEIIYYNITQSPTYTSLLKGECILRVKRSTIFLSSSKRSTLQSPACRKTAQQGDPDLQLRVPSPTDCNWPRLDPSTSSGLETPSVWLQETARCHSGLALFPSPAHRGVLPGTPSFQEFSPKAHSTVRLSATLQWLWKFRLRKEVRIQQRKQQQQQQKQQNTIIRTL